MRHTQNSRTDYILRGSTQKRQVLQKSVETVLPRLNRNYLNEFGLFYFLFSRLPNKITEKNIKAEKARVWFLEHYGYLVVEEYFNKLCFGQQPTAQLDDCFFILKPDLIVCFDTQQSIVRYLFKETALEVVEKLVEELNAFKDEPQLQAEIYLLVQRSSSFDIEKFKLKTPDFSLEDNYNDDLMAVHEVVLNRLNTKNDKGIVLLHGEPGTGKTSYIRYLTSVVKKKVIFFPPNMAESITHPSFITLLMDNPNSILVIEDAENILLDRNYNDKSSVSALLNLTDGLLADCLSIQVVCSFNTDLAKIDSALLRKGRLIASYKFEVLNREKAQSLSEKLGHTHYIAGPMRLTDVYNQDHLPRHEAPKKRIGFLNN